MNWKLNSHEKYKQDYVKWEKENKGNVVNHEIFESVINSKIQMTYKKVNKWLEEGIVEAGYELKDDETIKLTIPKIVTIYPDFTANQ